MSARIIHLPSGRQVLDTGRVQIGLRHGEPPATPRGLAWGTHRPQLSRDAERLQSVMLSEDAFAKPHTGGARKAHEDWLDDEEIRLEMAQRDAEAFNYMGRALDRLVMLARWIIGAVAAGVIAWLGWTAAQ